VNEYGESIYGTRGGIIEPRDWGVTTQKGNKIYVHILNLEDDALYLPIQGKLIASVKQYIDGKPIKFTTSEKGILLNLNSKPDAIDYVLEIDMK
jgi:alpha-L-fucosidase